MITTYRQRLEAMVGPERISTTSISSAVPPSPSLGQLLENFVQGVVRATKAMDGLAVQSR
jgi:hypothetical protein